MQPNNQGYIPVSQVVTLFTDDDCNEYLRHGWVLLSVVPLSKTDKYGDVENERAFVLGELTDG